VAVYGGKSKFEQFKELRAGSRVRACVRSFVRLRAFVPLREIRSFA
jgi:hypothetical protein